MYLNIHTHIRPGVGRSSGSRAPTFKHLDHPINSAWWMNLQFGLFFVPTSGPQLGYEKKAPILQGCVWESAFKRSLAAYRKE